ncbi:MAG: ABC transporter substrate-binding protein [Ruminococcus sp.]|nr:ABC transporter substrate-binding protein [Ruminococcus sp.]
MKKILLSVVCTLILFSCGNERVQKTPPDNKLNKCTLRFSWWGGDDRHNATMKAITLWNARHPNIEIKAEYGGWDGWTEKINTQISGGSEPDIMQINYDWLVTLSNDGEDFYDLNELNKFLDLSGFNEDILSFGTVNGHLNAVPVSLTGRGFFYNSEVFEKLGISYPETWDELMTTGEIFYENGCYPIDLDIQSGGTAWYISVVYVQQKTGREFLDMNGNLGFTVEDMETVLEFYKRLEENHVTRTVRERIDADGNSALYQSPEFIQGNIAGVLEWNSAVGKYESVLDKGVLEAGNYIGDENGNNSGWFVKPSLLYAVSANTKYPDEAGAFIDFLLNDKECADILGTSRGIPASRYAEEELEKTGKLDGLTKQNADMLDAMNTVTISPYMELSRMKEFYNMAIERVSYGKGDIPEIAQELYDNITEYLESIK